MGQWLWAERKTSNRRKPSDSDRDVPSCVVTYQVPIVSYKKKSRSVCSCVLRARPAPFRVRLRVLCVRHSSVVLALFYRFFWRCSSPVLALLFLRYSTVVLALFRCYSGFVLVVIATAPPPSATAGVPPGLPPNFPRCLVPPQTRVSPGGLVLTTNAPRAPRGTWRRADTTVGTRRPTRSRR